MKISIVLFALTYILIGNNLNQIARALNSGFPDQSLESEIRRALGDLAIKHLSSKNSDLGAAERYLIFQHDESNNKPVLDEYGHLIPREDYRIDTVLCGDEDFAIACMKTNLLRQQIRAALKKSKTLEDFFDVLLEDYGVAVKESRGRFSYLTPERTKPITSRKLGDDFSKEAILAVLEQNASRIIPPVSQRPDTFVTPMEKPEIEKLIDLEAKRAEGKGEGYIHWGIRFYIPLRFRHFIC